jgi:hypothetical protein
VVKAYDYKTNQMLAIKIIRNKKRFHHQALVEVITSPDAAPAPVFLPPQLFRSLGAFSIPSPHLTLPSAAGWSVLCDLTGSGGGESATATVEPVRV